MGDSIPSQSTPSPADDMTAKTTTATTPTAAAATTTTTARPTRPRNGSAKSTTNMNGPLYMQTSGNNRVLVRRIKRKDDTALKHLARWFIENQIGLSFNLVALLFLAHVFIPKARTHTHKFFHLSYYNPESGKYAIGFDDAYIIFFSMVFFTGLRAGTMEYVLAPLGKLNGISKRKGLTRFSEQAWMIIYYTVFWSIGVYIYANSPHYFNLRELWTDFPNREMGGLMKAYMLLQLSFYVQLMVVLNIEERRKDHWQMFTHHIITGCLIWASYTYNLTRVGNLILIIMDNGDILLPLAKCLKYCGFSTLCDVMFGIFMLAWVVFRHIFYNMVCWSIYKHTLEIIGSGCYKGSNDNLIGPMDPPPGYSYLYAPLFSTTGLICYDRTIMWSFLAPLLALQGLAVIWFVMILRIAIRVISGAGADDSRSDDEDAEEEDEDEEEFFYEEAQPVEEEVGVESLDLKGWERRAGVKRQGNSSGVSLPGHSDRKELLGRIGCDKQVD